jgi:PAS domain S-box-containing protein
VSAFSEISDFRTGIGRLLETIGQGFGCDVGEYWEYSAASATLSLNESTWASAPEMLAFSRSYADYVLRRGGGIPGKVLATRAPLQFDTTQNEGVFLRSESAAALGLKSGFAFPICDGKVFHGVMFFVFRKAQEPTPELDIVLETLGLQIAQFAERRRAEETIRKQQALHEAILDNLPVSVFVKDESGRFLFANQMFLNFFDETRDTLIGKTDDDFLTPVKAAAYRADDRFVCETGRMIEREETNERNGRSTVFLTRKTPIENAIGDGVAVCGVSTDITNQKRFENALKLSESRYRSIVDHQTELLCRYLADGTYTFVNEGFCRFFGTTYEKIIGRKLGGWILPEDIHAVRAAVASISVEKPVVPTTTRAYDNSGRVRWLEFVNCGFFDESGTVVEIQAVGRDVTERKIFETELRRSKERYRAVVEDQTEMICRLSLDGKFTFVNDACARILGASKDELLGSEWARFIPPEELPNAHADLASVTPEKPVAAVRGRVISRDDVRIIDFVIRGFFDAAGTLTEYQAVGRDITERMAIETELRRSEERYRAVVEDQTELISRLTPDGVFTFVNGAYPKMLGNTRADMIGQRWQSFVHDEDVAQVESKIDLITPAAPDVTVTFRILKVDGTSRWVEFVVRGFFDEIGTMTELQAVGRDITERQSVEALVRESEKRFRQAFDAAQLGLWDWNVSTGVVDWNDILFARMGYEPGEIPSTFETWASSLHPDDRDAVLSSLRRYYEGETAEYHEEFRILTAQGEVHWHMAVGKAVERDAAGNPTRMIGINQDITERKLTEVRLRTALNRLKMATDAADIAIWSWDFRTDILEWDERMIEWYGRPSSEEDAPILYDYWRSRVDPDDFARVVALQASSRDPNTPMEYEFRILGADGQIHHIHSVCLTEHDTQDKPIRRIGINRDITAQRQQEQNLLSAKQAADEANASKSRFLAHMSHEVRSPLTAVLGYADMLMEPGLSKEEADQAVHAIRRNGAHLLTVLDDVLDMSKIEAGKMQIEFFPYSPWKLAIESRTLLKARADERRIDLATIPTGDLPDRAMLDPTRFRQVLVNLLSNAVKFSDPGSVVELRVSATPDSLTFEVQDQGIGMTPEQLKRVFLPFQQADVTTTRRFGGTGLGLTITSEIVKALGGSIQVSSEPGKGSLFAVKLPLVWPKNLPAPAWIAAETLVGKAVEKAKPSPLKVQTRLTGRVLLVEDGEDNRRVILHILKRFGLAADVAVNGAEAVEAATRTPFDLILMDLEMPVMDGFAATQTLRDAGYLRPIVALTAFSMVEDREKAIRIGCTEYLTKPVDMKLFAEMLTRHLTPEA